MINLKNTVNCLSRFDDFIESLLYGNGVLDNIENQLSSRGIFVVKDVLSKQIDLSRSLINKYPRSFASVFEHYCLIRCIPQYDNCLNNAPEVEVDLLLNGVKPTARLVKSTKDLANLISYCKEKSLHFLISPFLVTQSKNRILKYSNKIEEAAALSNNNEGDLFIYLARDFRSLITVWIAELLGDHRAVGKMLGYPSCCIDFFTANIERAYNSYCCDMTVIILQNDFNHRVYMEFPCWANSLAGYLGGSLILHFPCSFNCPETVALSRKYYKLLMESPNTQCTGLKKSMECLIIYTLSDGVFGFFNYKTDNSEIYYDPGFVEATNDQSLLLSLLKHGNRIEFSQEHKNFKILHDEDLVDNWQDDFFIANFC